MTRFGSLLIYPYHEPRTPRRSILRFRTVVSTLSLRVFWPVRLRMKAYKVRSRSRVIFFFLFFRSVFIYLGYNLATTTTLSVPDTAVAVPL